MNLWVIIKQRKFVLEEFAIFLCERFADKTVIGIVNEFNKLKHIGDVEDYQEKFKQLKTYMLIENLHFISPIFLIVLKMDCIIKEIKSIIYAAEPKMLNQAFY